VFLLVGVVLMGVERMGALLVFFLFRVFRLYTAPLVCTLCNTSLCSSCAETWFLIKLC